MFESRSPISLGSQGFPERRIPGKNGKGQDAMEKMGRLFNAQYPIGMSFRLDPKIVLSLGVFLSSGEVCIFRHPNSIRQSLYSSAWLEGNASARGNELDMLKTVGEATAQRLMTNQVQVMLTIQWGNNQREATKCDFITQTGDMSTTHMKPGSRTTWENDTFFWVTSKILHVRCSPPGKMSKHF